MEIILNETIPSLGFVGDVVKVKPGYARNYLFPRGVAVEASKHNKKRVEHRKRLLEVKRATLLKEAQGYRDRLVGVCVSVEKTVSPEGKLYGSVTTTEIAEHLAKGGITIDRKLIITAEPIRSLGEHTVSIKLHPDVVATVKVEVKKSVSE